MINSNNTAQNNAPICLINGIAADYININDRSLHYGDGLFETILCLGNQLYYWKQHYQRLKVSSKKLNISCPHEHLLLQDIKQLLLTNDKPVAIKIILSRGHGQRGYQYDKNIRSNRILIVSEIDAGYSSLLTRQLLSGDLYLCDAQVSINKNLAGLKHLNRLENVLARNEWSVVADKTKNYIDGVMLNHLGFVIETTMSNIFIIKDNVVITPALSLSGVNGVMRQFIIKQASETAMPVSVENVSLDQLMTADEIFISNSLIAIKAINYFNNKDYCEHKSTLKLFNHLVNTMDSCVEVIN